MNARLLTLSALLAGAFFTFGTGAQAQTAIPVVNSGFESPSVGAGGYTNGSAIPGWTDTSSSSGNYGYGVQDDGGGAGDANGGSQILYLNAGSVYQSVLSGALTAGATYTLTGSAFGRVGGQYNPFGDVFSLYTDNGSGAPGTLLTTEIVIPAQGVFAAATVPYLATGTENGLVIVLDKGAGSFPNNQSQFDGIGLTVAAAPEPSQFAVFAVGLLGLGALSLKARRRAACA